VVVSVVPTAENRRETLIRAGRERPAVFVGHGLLAFAVVAVLGERLAWDRRATLSVALLAAGFGTLPDVDVVYAPVGFVLAGEFATPVESFWAAGNRVHRGVTHSLVVAVPTAAGAGLLARREPVARAAGLSLLTGVVAVATLVSGALAFAVTLVFVAAAVGFVAGARRYDVPARQVAGAALLGLFTHPFGDVFTGSPPAFLYPFDAVLLAERVTLSGDLTLHLLGAFWVELAVVWLAMAAYLRLTDRSVAARVERPAALGVAYGGAALVLPTPTLEVSYPFVYSVLGVGLLGAVSTRPPARPPWNAAVTALTAVSLASLSYAVVYLAV
jgi:membrane-bound metal-dependent hydrolase YbcI (DUF457 family)